MFINFENVCILACSPLFLSFHSLINISEMIGLVLAFANVFAFSILYAMITKK